MVYLASPSLDDLTTRNDSVCQQRSQRRFPFDHKSRSILWHGSRIQYWNSSENHYIREFYTIIAERLHTLRLLNNIYD